MKQRRILALSALLLTAIFAFTGCMDAFMPEQTSQADPAVQNDSERIAQQSNEEPQSGLLESDKGRAASSSSKVQLNANNTTTEYVLTNLYEGGGWNALYSNLDKAGKALSSVTLIIPTCAQKGDVYRYDDPTDYVYGNGGVMFYNARSGKSYTAMNVQHLTEENDSFGIGAMSQGNEYAIAIDDVSADGNVITGRFAVNFTKSLYEQNDGFAIDDSSFSLNLADLP